MKLGISCSGVVAKLGYDEAFSLIKKSGFDSVDISLESYGKKDNPLDIYNASEDQFEAYFDHIRMLAAKYDLVISQTHGRCRTFTPEPEQQEYACWVSKKDIQATSLLGAPGCIIHQIATGRWPENYTDVAFMHAKNKEFFDHLIPVAEKYKTAFSLETFGAARINDIRIGDLWADINLLKEQYSMLNTEYKAICVDTGHTNEAIIFGGPSSEDAIRILGKDVRFLHLHDNNGSYDQHLPPLMGDKGAVNWPGVFDALEDIGYEGVYNFELSLKKFYYALPEAVQFLGKFLRLFLENHGRSL